MSKRRASRSRSTCGRSAIRDLPPMMSRRQEYRKTCRSRSRASTGHVRRQSRPTRPTRLDYAQQSLATKHCWRRRAITRKRLNRWVRKITPPSRPLMDARPRPRRRAQPGRESRARAARGRDLNASGFFETEAAWSAIANSKGNFGFHRSTSAGFSATMRTQDGTGSGYAAIDAPRLGGVDAAALAQRAAVKAETSAKPRDLRLVSIP